MQPGRAFAVALGLLGLALSGGCGSAGAPGTTAPTGVDGLVVPTPSPDPDDFVPRIDNPYLPLVPGSTWTYESKSSTGTETITVTVTDETRTVAGVETTVVHDEVRDARGKLVEDTYDWFAQDRAGNVWYFGEDTTAYDEDPDDPEDSTVSTEGSWEAGVDGAMAGVAMLAAPRIGDGYRQEFLEGVAEDRAEVLRVSVTLDLDTESYDDVVVTSDTTPLEPDLEERKYYAPGIGLVAEETVRGEKEQVRLVTYTPAAPAS
ncbi:hypothetical protein [Nocardioides bigeumensis]